eukprot:Em0012g321a
MRWSLGAWVVIEVHEVVIEVHEVVIEVHEVVIEVYEVVIEMHEVVIEVHEVVIEMHEVVIEMHEVVIEVYEVVIEMHEMFRVIEVVIEMREVMVIEVHKVVIEVHELVIEVVIEMREVMVIERFTEKDMPLRNTDRNVSYRIATRRNHVDSTSFFDSRDSMVRISMSDSLPRLSITSSIYNDILAGPGNSPLFDQLIEGRDRLAELVAIERSRELPPLPLVGCLPPSVLAGFADKSRDRFPTTPRSLATWLGPQSCPSGRLRGGGGSPVSRGNHPHSNKPPGGH